MGPRAHMQQKVTGALYRFVEKIQTQTFNIYKNNEIIIQTIAEEITCLGPQNTEAKKVAGSATYKQSKTVWNYGVL